LLVSNHAYRLETRRVHNKARSTANSTAVQPAAYGSAYSSSQYVMSRSSSAYASRSVYQSSTVVKTTYGYSSRTTISCMAETCLPGMYGGSLVTAQPPPSPALAASWPLLLGTAVVLMGGVYLYHNHRMNSPPETLFCPVSSWQADAAGLLVSSSAADAYSGQLTTFLSADANNRGMPKCHGLRRYRLRAQCDGDVDCKRQACRQMCCDRRDCTFFQFNTIDSTDNCWLGSRNRLSIDTCEQPWYGETCTSCRERRIQLWPQIHGDHSKCLSQFFGTGYQVNNQYECQKQAVEMGHEYYQYDDSRKRCLSSASCEDPTQNTNNEWKIYSIHDVEMPTTPQAVVPPEDETWEFEPILFHEHGSLIVVRLTSVESCGSDASCMKDICRAKCLESDGCIHYQFKDGGDECHLGTELADEEDVGMWFGGILTSDRLCATTEYKCPSSGSCVASCDECSTHAREGPDNFCVRSPIQNMVDNNGWADIYDNSPIDAWCRGLERTVVTMSAQMSNGQSGADICKAACTSDPLCGVWQMYSDDAARTDYTEGSQVKCWLGMEDNMGRPLFSCTGRSPKRWRLLTSPAAQAIETRGCSGGKVSCVLTNNCVDLCQDECPGFSITDADEGLCQPPVNPAMMDDGVPMKVVVAGNLPTADLDVVNSLFADEGDLFTMSVNVERVIDPDTFSGDTTALCDVIGGAECDFVDGECVCDYDEEFTCEDLFGGQERVVPVLAEDGMLLLTGQECSCTGSTCNLGLLDSVPPVRLGENSTTAVHIGASEFEHCTEEVVCPNMDTCSVLKYGAHGCGYQCLRDETKYWCSSRCSCNQQEAVIECEVGVMCPDMDVCNPISYGDYGCGYGCTRGSSYYFCSDDCEECNM